MPGRKMRLPWLPPVHRLPLVTVVVPGEPIRRRVEMVEETAIWVRRKRRQAVAVVRILKLQYRPLTPVLDPA
jgi:hypothetical protein